MRTMVKNHRGDIYYDIYFGSKRYWKQVGEKMHGYCMLSNTIIDHMNRPIDKFQFLDKEPKKPGRTAIISPSNNLVSNPALECASGG